MVEALIGLLILCVGLLSYRLSVQSSRIESLSDTLHMVINCQDHMEKDLYGDADTEGLDDRIDRLIEFLEGDQHPNEDLLVRIESLELSRDAIEATLDVYSQEAYRLRERIRQLEAYHYNTLFPKDKDWWEKPKFGPYEITSQVSQPDPKQYWSKTGLPQNMKEAGWQQSDDPMDLFKKPCCDETKREERCLAGQCHPVDCEREQCPHRTQEWKPTYSGLLDGFPAEWDLVQQQGQVELPTGQTEGVSPKGPNPQPKAQSE